MKVYPKYKDSGVPWLGDVPEHWEIRKLKTVANVKASGVDKHSHENEISVQLCNYTDVYKNHKITNAIKFMKATATEEEIHSFELVAGDVIITKDSETWDDIAVPSYVPNDLTNVICAYHLSLIRPFCSSYGLYLSFAFQVQPFANQFKVSANGVTRFGLSKNTIKNSFFFVPTQDEQQQISRYLDWQTSKINQFIKAKKKVIALLKEQKQNIINEAVTKGINPSVEMKDSGVVWIRDIPEHWQSVRLKHCVSSIDQGWSPQCETQPAEANEWGVLKVGCVNGDHFNFLQNKKLPDGLTPRLQCRIQENDIVVSRANTRELVGLAAIVDKSYPNILLCDKLYRFTAKKDVAVARFLVYSIRCSASREQIEERATGASSSMQNISQSVIRNLLISLPPLDEQQSIVDCINQETALIDKTIARTEREIELIQEYRTRLVSDVVTGKVDIRSVEIPDFEPAETDLEVQDDEESEDELITEGIEE